MAVPGRRKSKSKTRKGRNQMFISLNNVINCKMCGALKINHRICLKMQHYKNKKFNKPHWLKILGFIYFDQKKTKTEVEVVSKK